MVLDRRGLRVAVVALDLVIVRPSLRDDLLEPARRLGVDALIVTATHTHSGPGGYIPGWLAARLTAGSFEPEMPERLASAARRALERAVGDLAPARVAAGATELELARNRRFDDGRDETRLLVLRVDFDGRPPALLYAYGAHPTVLSPRSRRYSADYPGAAHAWLEARGWRPLFLPGPLGDQEPVPDGDELWPRDPAQQRQQVEAIGARLGAAVADAAGDLQPRADVTLAALERWVHAPPTRLRRFCAIWWVGPLVGGTLRSFFSERVPLHAVRVGDAEIVTLPAEPSSSIGEEIRRRVPEGRVPFVVAHSNDWLGYVVSPATYQRGGYEACMSFHGPGLGPWLVQEAAETMRLLESRQGDRGE